MTTFLHKLFSILLFLTYPNSASVRAALLNVTIDDQYGDEMTGAIPGYLPLQGDWPQGANCVGCLAKPDPNLAQNGTWHDTTWHPDVDQDAPRSINLIFNGSAIYVYFILANYIPYVTTGTNLSFVLDEELVGNFVHIPNNSTDYEYNQLAYGNSSLSSNPSNQHQLTINTVGTTNPSLVLFDYALRTTDSDESNASGSTSTVPSIPASSTDKSSTLPTSKISVNTNSSSVDSRNTRSTSIPSSLSVSSEIIVTTPSSSSSEFSTTTNPLPTHVRSSSSFAPVVGGIIGGIVSLILLLLLVYFIYRRKLLRNRTSPYRAGGGAQVAIPGRWSAGVDVEEVLRPITYRDYALFGDPGNGVTHVVNNSLQIQQVMIGLHSQSRSTPQDQQGATSSSPREAPSPDLQELRRQVLTLRAEVENLRTAQEELVWERDNMERLPDYNEISQLSRLQ